MEQGNAPNWAVPAQHHQQQQQVAPQQQVPQQPQGYPPQQPQEFPPPAQTANVGGPPHGAPPAHSVTPPPAPVKVLHKNNRMATMEDKVLVTRTADEEMEDGRIRNKEAMAKIRDAWVYKQVRARVDEFTEYKKVRRDEWKHKLYYR
jgi:hypothetical protein